MIQPCHTRCSSAPHAHAMTIEHARLLMPAPLCRCDARAAACIVSTPAGCNSDLLPPQRQRCTADGCAFAAWMPRDLRGIAGFYSLAAMLPLPSPLHLTRFHTRQLHHGLCKQQQGGCDVSVLLLLRLRTPKRQAAARAHPLPPFPHHHSGNKQLQSNAYTLQRLRHTCHVPRYSVSQYCVTCHITASHVTSLRQTSRDLQLRLFRLLFVEEGARLQAVARDTMPHNCVVVIMYYALCNTCSLKRA